MTESDEFIHNLSADEEENTDELSLRPQFLREYIGQQALKDELTVYIKAAKMREDTLDHLLIYDPPGLGKTTLAMIIANEMQAPIKTTSGPTIEVPGDLLAILNELTAGSVLFIDEIHRLPTKVEEMLYSAMEDFYVDLVVGQGPSAKSIHFPLPPFTLVGATTRPGMLSKPLRDRFGIISAMDYYTPEELSEIVTRSAEIFEAPIFPEGAYEIARRSRGTPRIANRLLKRVRDFAQVSQKSAIDKQIVDHALTTLNVDIKGLDTTDIKLLTTMIEVYGGGPVGLTTIAANIGEESETVESMIEPYLLQIGFLRRTPRGREVTQKAYEHLNIPFQSDLL